MCAKPCIRNWIEWPIFAAHVSKNPLWSGPLVDGISSPSVDSPRNLNTILIWSQQYAETRDIQTVIYRPTMPEHRQHWLLIVTQTSYAAFNCLHVFVLRIQNYPAAFGSLKWTLDSVSVFTDLIAWRELGRTLVTNGTSAKRVTTFSRQTNSLHTWIFKSSTILRRVDC
jgi:hypothetical protein